MNKLLSTVVAGSMLLGSAAQAVTWNSDYGVITDLTPDHIAFLDEHRSADSGILAGFLWTRLADGSYVTTSVDKIREAGSPQAAATMIVNKIVEVEIEKIVTQEVTVIQEVIVEDRAEINRLQAQIDALTPLAAQVPGLNTQITNLTADKVALEGRVAVLTGDIAGLNAMIADKDAQIANVTLERDNLLTDVNSKNIQIRDLNYDITALTNERNILRDAFNEVTNTRGGFLNTLAVDLGVSVDFVNGQIITNDPNGFLPIQQAFINGTSRADGVTFWNAVKPLIVALAPVQTLSFGTITSDILSDSNLDNYDRSHSTVDNVSNYAGTGGRGGERFAHIIVNGNIVRTAAIYASSGHAIGGLIEQIYDDAYNTGYDAGYVDGYTDGFTDGQSSVTLN